MSHFNACILIMRNGSSFEQMMQKASDKLADFDINKDMEPYKYYVNDDQIQRMAKSYGIDLADLHALAEKLEDWDGDKGGVDKTGLYGISTKNPKGHTDFWSVFAEVKPEDRGRLLFGEGGEEKVVKAIVTPDGMWVDGPWVYISPNAEQDKEMDEWDKKVLSILQKYPDAVAFLADCHI